MEPVRSTFEVFKGNDRASVEMRKVANGYVISHYPIRGPHREYVALDEEKAKDLVSACLKKGKKEKVDKEEDRPEVYPNAY